MPRWHLPPPSCPRLNHSSTTSTVDERFGCGVRRYEGDGFGMRRLETGDLDVHPISEIAADGNADVDRMFCHLTRRWRQLPTLWDGRPKETLVSSTADT